MIKLSPLHRKIIIGLSVSFTVAIIAVVLIVFFVVFKRKETQNIVVTSVPPVVIPTIVPNITHALELQNDAGQCFFFNSFKPVFSGPGDCTFGHWLYDSTDVELTFAGSDYQYCINAPGPTSFGETIIGISGGSCDGVQLKDGVIRGVVNDLCINNVSGALVWNDCASAFSFKVRDLTNE